MRLALDRDGTCTVEDFRRGSSSNGASPAAEVATIRTGVAEVSTRTAENVTCKRRSVPPERPLAHVGDGSSDLCAAGAADRVLARGWLAAELQRRGVPHDRFETLDGVAAALS